MRLVAVATLLSSLTLVACEREAPPPAAPTVVVVKPTPPAPPKPAPAPAPTPTPTPKDSLQIGPGGVVVETNDANQETRVKIDFPKR